MPAHVVAPVLQRRVTDGGRRHRVGSSLTSTGGPAALGKSVPPFVRMLRDPNYGGRVYRFIGTVFDRLIVRDRHPTMYRPNYIPPADNWVSWTAAGPARPTLHMRQATWREWSGSSASRFPYIPDSPTGGMHTNNAEQGATRTLRRYQATPQQKAARFNRLSASRYHGQTYSQQTVVQGGRAGA